MPNLKISIIAACVSLSVSHMAMATSAEKSSEETVIVTATKIDRNILDVAQAVSVKTDKDIEQQQATSINEVLNRMPGVRYGDGFYSSPSVRGGSQDRVVINIDGVNQTSSTNKGMTPNPISIDPMLLKQVEVLKGSSSALYGSGGMGGVIAIKTKTADDLLNHGDNFGGFVRTRFDSFYDNFYTTGALYGRSENNFFDYLLTADGFNTESDNKNSPVKNQTKTRRFATQFGLNFNPEHRLQLNLKHQENRRSNFIAKPDEIENQTIQLVHTLSAGDNVNLKSTVSYNSIERETYLVSADKQQDSDVDRLQLDAQNTHYFSMANTDHEITYGINYLRTDQTGIVNGEKDNFASANGERKETGLFLQDSIDWNIVTLTAALRYVDYEMEGGDDQYDMDDQKVLPSLGLVVRATEWLSLYGSYAKDFRAPSIDDMYTELDLSLFGMKVVPNPDLKPEESKNYEFGFGLHSQDLFTDNDHAKMRVTFFDQDVKNLISVDPEGTFDPINLVMLYTSLNIADANRSGVELELSYATDNFSFSAATDYLKIENNNDDTVTHYPRHLNTSLGYKLPEYGIDLVWLTDSASRSEISGAGYVLHGLRVRYVHSNIEISAGVDNATDHEYINEFGVEGRERTYRLGVALTF